MKTSLSDSLHMEDLIDRLLLIVTLNSTLMHFMISSQVDGYVDPDRVDSLTQGLIKTRSWMEEATTMKGIPPSTSNIMSLIVKRLSQIESVLPKLSGGHVRFNLWPRDRVDDGCVLDRHAW